MTPHSTLSLCLLESIQTYDDYNALLPVLHCFYEAVRLFRKLCLLNDIAVGQRLSHSAAAGWVTMRESETDEVLTAPHLTPMGNDLTVPKGTIVVIDVIGGCRSYLSQRGTVMSYHIRIVSQAGTLASSRLRMRTYPSAGPRPVTPTHHPYRPWIHSSDSLPDRAPV